MSRIERDARNPYPVIINEAIEVTKTFGGTDGHKFVNGILDKPPPNCARTIRNAATYDLIELIIKGRLKVLDDLLQAA